MVNSASTPAHSDKLLCLLILTGNNPMPWHLCHKVYSGNNSETWWACPLALSLSDAFPFTLNLANCLDGYHGHQSSMCKSHTYALAPLPK